MILEPQLTYREVPPSEAVTQYVHNHVHKLGVFHPRIMSCRVVIEAPHRHHRIGSHYRVLVDVTLPGGEVIAGGRSTDDHVRQDVYAAVDDAFDEARRVVEDYARTRRGETKRPSRPPRGRVSKLFPDEGYGFIATTEGEEVYFHRNSVLNDGFDRLEIGHHVRFEAEDGDKGPQASTVAPAKH